MKTHSFIWRPGEALPPAAPAGADLVLYFGPRQWLARRECYAALRQVFPTAALLGCSGGGQIMQGLVEDDTITGLAMKFASARVKLYRQTVTAATDARSVGLSLGHDLAAPDLVGIIVLSDGLSINGSELAEGIAAAVPPSTPIAGGMAADGETFQQTLVGANCSPSPGVVAAAGLYGTDLHMRTGFGGGWTVFGPRRRITGATRNVLTTLDDQPAIPLYEAYLGPEAKGLPGSGLRFPLLIRDPENPSVELIRTLLALDREKGTMTFAGNLPLGWTAQLMRANPERLAGGAGEAGRLAAQCKEAETEVALLVSCIGRKLVLGQRIEDEIEAVQAGLHCLPAMIGFYSYGEFAPLKGGGPVELHNQTMTVMTLTERAA